jgi:hypothetical protein
MMAPLPGSNLPSMESLVEGFQQLGPDLWLPERVRVAYYDYESLKQGKLIPNLTRSLVLESAAMPVAYPAGKFQLAIPEGIPLYTVGTDGVVDSPHHPRPATQERSTTLDEIRAGMRRNEALFENLDITVEERYIKPWIANEFFSSNLGEGSIAGSETFSYVNRTRSVSLGGRHYVREEQKLTHKDGTPYTTATIATTDGEWRRQVSTSNEDDPHTFVLQWPSLTRRSDAHARRIRAHALIFDPYDDLLERNLSDYLDSEWSNERNSYRHAVAYEGDDLIDGLLCHRLRIDHLNGQERQVSNNRYVWLCRDRNLLPIRTQWLESLWHPTLITGMSTVDEWRELKRGVWLPVRWTHVAFKRTDPSGLCENRLIHNWRKDSRVEEVTLDPRPDPELFRSVTAPRGTEISIRDASGKVLGKILQEQDGILTISPQKWRELSKPAEPATEGKPPADNNGAAGA